MTSRQQRRAAERVAAKLARKQAQQEPTPTVSEARLIANQANAQLSSGPVTAAGKAASSKNSFKHGLYSKKLVIEGEDPAELDALRADLSAEHQPQTQTEALLVNELAEQYWRLRRARRLEVLFLKNEPLIAHLTATQRMMTSAERGFHKALKTLTELQKQRGFVPQKPLMGAASEATGAPAGGFVPQKPAVVQTKADAQNGFVPQNGSERTNLDDLEEIEEVTALDRQMQAA